MGPCVVVVEDEPDVLDVIRETLDMEGFEAIGFNHPYQVDALTVSPDLFLLDIMLPKRSGIEVAERLRTAGHTETPMVAMSASRVMLSLAEATGLFQAFLNKPFDLEQLIGVLQHTLASPKPSQVPG